MTIMTFSLGIGELVDWGNRRNRRRRRNRKISSQLKAHGSQEKSIR
jgi:hypothetical protein